MTWSGRPRTTTRASLAIGEAPQGEGTQSLRTGVSDGITVILSRSDTFPFPDIKARYCARSVARDCDESLIRDQSPLDRLVGGIRSHATYQGDYGAQGRSQRDDHPR